MSRKAKKYSIVLLTVCLGAAVFAMTAFAETGILPASLPASSGAPGFRAVALTAADGAGSQAAGDSGTGEQPGDGTGQPGTGDSGNSSGNNGTGSSTGDNGNGNASSGSGSSSSSKAEDNRIDVLLNYNDGSEPKVVRVAPGTQVKTLSVPERKGYEFDCWTMNGVEVSPSLEIYTEISLTARWEVSTASSKAPSSYASVDTHKSEVEQAASRAAEAISDPDVLSSEDWNSLLSTPSEAAAGVGTLSSAASSQPSQGGGGSWLFPVGIGLIVLAACGVGAFVYLQFFGGAGPRIPPGPAEGGGFKNVEFTDISSHSDGPYDAPDGPDEPEAPRPGGGDDTRPVPPEVRRAAAQGGTPKAQAQPVNGEKGDFDWDKFFSDDF